MIGRPRYCLTHRYLCFPFGRMIHSIQISTAVLQRLPAMIPILVTLGGNFGKDISLVSLEALGKGYLPAL